MAKLDDINGDLDKIIEGLEDLLKFYKQEKLSVSKIESEADLYFYHELLKDYIDCDRNDLKNHQFNKEYLDWCMNSGLKPFTNNQSKFAKLLLYNRKIIQVGMFDGTFYSVMKYLRNK